MDGTQKVQSTSTHNFGPKVVFRAALCLLLVSPTAAFAEGLYFGGNYSRFEFSDKNIDKDETVNPDGITLRIGVEPVKWFGVEARGAVGIKEDKRQFTGGSLAFDLDELYGAYAKVGVPVGDVVMPYAIAGYSRVKGSANLTVLGISTSETETWEDQSIGAGVDLNLSESLALNVEFMRYLDKDDQELSAVNLGLRSAF
ncbi:MAG: porin family protein [Alcanivoracaceae bacterium]|nr:porin family protein [Alcanivoracaceae bacterium]